MLKIEKLKARLVRLNHPDALRIGVDFINENRLYIIVNDGIDDINCDPIELYETEIKICVLEMITQGKLYLETNEKSLRIGQGRSIYCSHLKKMNIYPKVKLTTDTFTFLVCLFVGKGLINYQINKLMKCSG